MALFFVSLILLVAIFGFWDMLAAILGGVAIAAILLVATVGFAGWSGYRAFTTRRS